MQSGWFTRPLGDALSSLNARYTRLERVPPKTFLSSRELTRAFPGVFPERAKRGNYHRRIVYGCDKGVCRGHVARARSRDARRCQARRRFRTRATREKERERERERERSSFIYLNNSIHPDASISRPFLFPRARAHNGTRFIATSARARARARSPLPPLLAKFPSTMKLS